MTEKTENVLQVYEPVSAEVARCLITAGAYLIDFNRPKSEWYLWKSGITAPCYCNCRGLPGHPQERQIAVNALCAAMELFPQKADVALGIEAGGISWGSFVTQQRFMSSGFVRKKVKEHGTGALIEGKSVAGHKVVLIDDLIGSGETVANAATAVENAGGEIIGILSLVNWNFAKMRSRLLNKYPVVCTISYPQVVRSLQLLGKITEEQGAELIKFYENPQAHEWRTKS